MPVMHVTWLAPVYLPLNSRVTIAQLSRDGTKAYFWEVYQVSPDVAQRRLPSGSWFMMASKDKLNRTSNDNKNDIPNDKHILEPDTALQKVRQSSTKMTEKTATFGRIIAVEGDLLMRRTDLTGLHLTCTTVVAPPLTELSTTKSRKSKPGGIYGSAFLFMKEITNFT
ncbi:uncharacterized protein LOC123502798 [Portunus trituberculatus]|nr:uncharacterized protein LOC123502798 [Portunus trituberculatus]